MSDNWYETAVSMLYPHNIISVVDWASDSPIPKNPPAQRVPATYNVWAWGVNDPSEGSRSIEKENLDSLASPLGWHVIPAASDPLARGTSKGEFVNTTTTRGNNVRIAYLCYV